MNGAFSPLQEFVGQADYESVGKGKMSRRTRGIELISRAVVCSGLLTAVCLGA
jgi:hypothetical protein